VSSEPKEKVTLRPKEAVMNSRKTEIIRTLRDAAEAGQVAEIEWITELAELAEVDLRKR
jgi:3-dehydroquinate dehydratase